MYEMEGPRRVPPRTTGPVARASALRRDTRPADLASQLPGRRLRRDSRRATLTSRSPGRFVRRDVRLQPWQADCSATPRRADRSATPCAA
jgi:hypothetical protein